MHLSGQVEDLMEMESDVVKRLKVILGAIEKRQQQKKPYKVSSISAFNISLCTVR